MDGEDYYYSSWLYIKISETSRPVYGLLITKENSYPPLYGYYEVFLHKKSENRWIHIEGDEQTFGGERRIIFRPSGWAWSDIDAILITYEDDQSEGPLNYVALLTTSEEWDERMDGPISFCMEGVDQNSNDYFRIVDNGITCYWNLSCPHAGYGWKYSRPTTVTGILGECKCSSGDCGLGYCERTTSWGKRYCIYGVRCMNGGWRFEGIKECKAGETCDYNGGTCSIKIL